MTENKRFILCNKTTDSNVWDTLEKQCYGWEYVVSLLNSFDGTIKNLSDDYQQLMEENKELKEENEQLKSENKNLKSNVDDLMDMELEDRDIVCMAGKFRLEEWGKHRLHQFYDGDTPLEDETVVMRLLNLTKENEQLKSENNMLKVTIGRNEAYIKRLTETSEWHC